MNGRGDLSAQPPPPALGYFKLEKHRAQVAQGGLELFKRYFFDVVWILSVGRKYIVKNADMQ